MIFKVLSSVVDSIINNYVCDDYLCCLQTKLHVENKGFENITYNDILIIGIPELLMIIISFLGFLNDTNSAVILSCCRKLVDYYISKGFVILENNSSALSIVIICGKQIMNVEHLYKNYSVMACYREISSEANTLKIITICSYFYIDFEST